MRLSGSRTALGAGLLPAMLAACLATVLSAEPSLRVPPQLQGVRIDEKLGDSINLDLEFVAENGYPVKLREFFHKDRPVILNLVYYSCPMLCTLVLNGQVDVLRKIAWTPGKEFEVVTISIDPTEHFGLAREKRGVYLSSYERPAPGWHFLTDYQGNVKRLAEQVGFHYRFDSSSGQYAHAAAIMVLTPEGKVSRYLYGHKFKPLDVRLAITEASEGKVRMSVERFLLWCYRYDHQAGSYVLFAMNVMRAAGILTVLIIAFFLRRLFRSERRELKEGMA